MVDSAPVDHARREQQRPAPARRRAGPGARDRGGSGGAQPEQDDRPPPPARGRSRPSGTTRPRRRPAAPRPAARRRARPRASRRARAGHTRARPAPAAACTRDPASPAPRPRANREPAAPCPRSHHHRRRRRPPARGARAAPPGYSRTRSARSLQVAIDRIVDAPSRSCHARPTPSAGPSGSGRPRRRRPPSSPAATSARPSIVTIRQRRHSATTRSRYASRATVRRRRRSDVTGSVNAAPRRASPHDTAAVDVAESAPMLCESDATPSRAAQHGRSACSPLAALRALDAPSHRRCRSPSGDVLASTASALAAVQPQLRSPTSDFEPDGDSSQHRVLRVAPRRRRAVEPVENGDRLERRATRPQLAVALRRAVDRDARRQQPPSARDSSSPSSATCRGSLVRRSRPDSQRSPRTAARPSTSPGSRSPRRRPPSSRRTSDRLAAAAQRVDGQRDRRQVVRVLGPLVALRPRTRPGASTAAGSCRRCGCAGRSGRDRRKRRPSRRRSRQRRRTPPAPDRRPATATISPSRSTYRAPAGDLRPRVVERHEVARARPAGRAEAAHRSSCANVSASIVRHEEEPVRAARRGRRRGRAHRGPRSQRRRGRRQRQRPGTRAARPPRPRHPPARSRSTSPTRPRRRSARPARAEVQRSGAEVDGKKVFVKASNVASGDAQTKIAQGA